MEEMMTRAQEATSAESVLENAAEAAAENSKTTPTPLDEALLNLEVEFADLKAKEEQSKLLLFEPPLSDESRTHITEILAQLNDLVKDILGIKEAVLNQNSTIKARVLGLEEAGKEFDFSIDTEHADANIAQYTQLLERIIEEINLEKSKHEERLALRETTYIAALDSKATTFDQFIREDVSTAKKQVKKIRKDLNVSFSRYQISFQNQMARFARMEFVINYNKQQNAIMQQVEAQYQKKKAAEAIADAAKVIESTATQESK